MEMNNNNVPQFYSFSLAKENIPVFSEEGRGTWINYGKDNNYDKYLVGLIDSSSKHNAIIKRKTDLTAGQGWLETIGTTSFISNHAGSENLNDIGYKNGYDLNLYGSFAMIVTWSKDRQSIARIQYISPSKIRIAKDIEEKEDKERYARQEDGVEFYYVSDDWSQARKAKYKPEIMQGYSKEYNDVATQLVYVKEYRPGTEYYTLPDYIASIDWIELDKEISNFHLNSVKNGFTPSMIISFNNGIPTAEEQDQIYKQVQKRYAGTDNASNVFITFSEGGENTPTFTPVNLNGSDDRFLMLEEHIVKNMMIAHRIPPLVAGVAIEGKLGSTSEIIESEAMFQSQVISQKQRLIERTYTDLINQNGESAIMKLNIVSTFGLIEDISEEHEHENK